MKKSEILKKALELLEKYEITDKDLIADFETAFASQRTKLPESYEENGTMFHWCKWHKGYEAEENMVRSSGISKGYCKKCYKLWDRLNKMHVKPLKEEIKSANEELMNAKPEDMVKLIARIKKNQAQLEEHQETMNHDSDMYQEHLTK